MIRTLLKHPGILFMILIRDDNNESRNIAKYTYLMTSYIPVCSKSVSIIIDGEWEMTTPLLLGVR